MCPPGSFQPPALCPGPSVSNLIIDDSSRGSLQRSSHIGAADTSMPECEEDDSALQGTGEEDLAEAEMGFRSRHAGVNAGPRIGSVRAHPVGNMLPGNTELAAVSKAQALHIDQGEPGNLGSSQPHPNLADLDGTPNQPDEAEQAEKADQHIPTDKDALNIGHGRVLLVPVELEVSGNGEEGVRKRGLKRNHNDNEANPLAAAVPPVTTQPPLHAPTTQMKSTMATGAAGTAGTRLHLGGCRLPLSSDVGVLQQEVQQQEVQQQEVQQQEVLQQEVQQQQVQQQEVQQLRQSLDVAYKNFATLIKERSKQDKDFSRVSEELSKTRKEVDKLKLKQSEDLGPFIRLDQQFQEMTDLNRQQLLSKDEQIAELQKELLNQALQDGARSKRGGGRN